MATKELQALYAQSMALIQGDQETDPIKRLFNARGLPEHAQLRARYAELLDAQANIQTCQQKIADISGRLWQMGTQLETIRPRYVDHDTPILSLEQSREWHDLRGLADLLNEDLGQLKAIESGLQLKLNDCGKAWDRVHQEWRSILWVETGQLEFQPPFLVADSDGKIWRRAEPFDRAGIEATRRRIEA
jgi:hypothetical protein